MPEKKKKKKVSYNNYDNYSSYRLTPLVTKYRVNLQHYGSSTR